MFYTKTGCVRLFGKLIYLCDTGNGGVIVLGIYLHLVFESGGRFVFRNHGCRFVFLWGNMAVKRRRTMVHGPRAVVVFSEEMEGCGGQKKG